jgi:hypothetical protein
MGLGKLMVGDFLRGLGSVDILGWVKDKFGGIVESIKNFFGIHSPSSVLHAIGKNLMLGFEHGIMSRVPHVANAAGAVSHGAIVERLSDRVSSLGKTAAVGLAKGVAVGAGAAAAAIAGVGIASVKAAMEAQAANAQTRAALQSTGGAREESPGRGRGRTSRRYRAVHARQPLIARGGVSATERGARELSLGTFLAHPGDLAAS